MRKRFVFSIVPLILAFFVVFPAMAQELKTAPDTLVRFRGVIEQVLPEPGGGGVIAVRTPDRTMLVHVTTDTQLRRDGAPVPFGELVAGRGAAVEGDLGPSGVVTAALVEVFVPAPTGTPPPTTGTPAPSATPLPVDFIGVIGDIFPGTEPGILGRLLVRTPMHRIDLIVPSEARVLDDEGNPIPFDALTPETLIEGVGIPLGEGRMRAVEIRVVLDLPPPPPTVTPGPLHFVGVISSTFPSTEPGILGRLIVRAPDRQLDIIVPDNARILDIEGQPTTFDALTVETVIHGVGMPLGEGRLQAIELHMAPNLPPPPTETPSLIGFAGVISASLPGDSAGVLGRLVLTFPGHHVEVVVPEEARLVGSDGTPITFADLTVGSTIRGMGMPQADGRIRAHEIHLAPNFPPPPTETPGPIGFMGVISASMPSDEPGLAGRLIVRAPFHRLEVLVPQDAVLRDQEGNPITFADLTVGATIRGAGLPAGEWRLRATEIRLIPDVPPPPTETPTLWISVMGHISATLASTDTNLVGILLLELPYRGLLRVLVPTDATIVDENGASISFTDLAAGDAVGVLATLVDERVLRAHEIRLVPNEPPPPPPHLIVRGEITNLEPDSGGTTGRFLLHRERFDESDPALDVPVDVISTTLIVNAEGQEIAFSDLEVGQLVVVEGLPQADHTLVAVRVMLMPAILPTPEPPIHPVIWEGTIEEQDATPGRWVVGGRPVIISETTHIDTSFGPAQVGAWVLVVARTTGDQRPPVAELVQVKPGPDHLLLRGEIQRIDPENHTWVVRNTAFRITPNTVIEGATPAVGLLAEVRLVHGPDRALVATHIHVYPQLSPPPLPARFHGTIQAMPDERTWTVNGQTIRVTERTIIRGTPAVGAAVEGFGLRNPEDNSITAFAAKVEGVDRRDHRVMVGRIEARPADGPVGEWRLTIRAADGTTTTATIVVTADTIVDESRGPAIVGAFAEVRAQADPAVSGRWVANRLRTIYRR